MKMNFKNLENDELIKTNEEIENFRKYLDQEIKKCDDNLSKEEIE